MNIILNTYVSYGKASKYMQQKLTELWGEIDNP